MFYIKNDDMEDMFKKAAENYELNEELAADWGKVRGILQSDEDLTIVNKKEKKRRTYWLWLLLFIPAISIITYKAGFNSSGKNQHEQLATAKKQNSALQNKASEKNNTAIKNNTAVNSVAANRGNNIHITNDENNTEKRTARTGSVSEKNQVNFHPNNKTFGGSTFVISPKQINANTFLNTQAFPQQNTATTKSLNQSVVENNLATNNIGNDHPDNKTNAVEINVSKEKKKTDNSARQAFAYAGVMGNADISFIKFQRMSSPGAGLGIVGGYHFKSGLSVETGILYEKKNYYTKGEYFDKSKLGYLRSVNLLSADGNCHMWEIPLNVKYDFNTQKKHNWFVTAGLSSYIMNKEYYNFKYEENGAVNERAYDYYHSSQNWFSILNVGGGINIKTGNKYFLQAQPYYKIPLSGVGKGNLSLGSAGINISIMRRLH
jgi:hypothetical protein